MIPRGASITVEAPPNSNVDAVFIDYLDTVEKLSINAFTAARSVGQAKSKVFTFDATAGRRYRIDITPLSGDPDIYAGSRATISSVEYDARSLNPTMVADSVTLTAGSTAPLYVSVRGRQPRSR